MIEKIFKILTGYKFNIGNEKLLQDEIQQCFNEAELTASKEYRLDSTDIVDFFVESHGIAIEVKIKGSKKSIYRQCERYTKHKNVKALILATSRFMGLPKEMNGKPIYFVNLSLAQL